jgi:signal transduction histidine kinase
MVLLGIVSVPLAHASEHATGNECIARCKAAAVLIKRDGATKAIAAIGNKDGQFVWKDSYVFLLNTKGKILAHPISPDLTQADNQLALRDASGKFIIKDFIRLAKSSGKGWVFYLWPRPGSSEPEPKGTYIYRVPNTDYIVGAGAYTSRK